MSDIFSTTKASTMIIEGGVPLHGMVRLGGAKNASYKLIIAALLANTESRLLNLPNILDVELVKKIINLLGAKAYSAGDKTVFIDPSEITGHKIPKEYGQVSRASTLFIGPLLAKVGKAEVPLPGGDKIGKRPLERHLKGLVKMGVKWDLVDGVLKLETNGLKGIHYKFAKNTHTGTETLIMAAVLADGQTVLENAAAEPEVDDLIMFLNAMGAKIKRTAQRKIEIIGVNQLSGAIHTVMPDRNEAVSYACAALVTKGDIIIENARQQDLTAFLEKIKEAGAAYQVDDWGIRFYYKDQLKAVDIETRVHPGFMTDWQPLWAVVMATATGKSVIHETVMQNRFQYVETLEKMGAKFELFNPQVGNPEMLYNFNWQDRQDTDFHALKILGSTKFHGGEFTVHDLRAGATTLLAAISGNGTTILHNVDQIDRGYEDLDGKLVQMGAKIKRQ